MKKLFIIIIILLLTSCTAKQYDAGQATKNSLLPEGKTDTSAQKESLAVKDQNVINPEGNTLQERIKVPEGFERVKVEDDSFAFYLRNLPLKAHDAKVLYYNGSVKNNDIHAAVIDIDVGSRDLQQCADAVMRLRAEYLYNKGEYDKIHFNFTNGFKADYSKWMQGYRIEVSQNKTSWVKKTESSRDYAAFRKYLDIVFAYAGTLSLSQELEPVPVKEMKIGDVFIKGGSPGHAVIVVDMAENKEIGEKIFLLAQSYMPAQDIHVLKNMQSEGLSPWYTLNFEDKLLTPEWTFEKESLKRFKE